MNFIFKIENNLMELFKGNLPLYKSYWIYYVLVNFLISAPLLLVTKIHIQNFIYTFSLYLVLNLIYYFTSCIGVWRSSQKYKGNKILSFLARLIVVIGISTTILELKTILTIIYSFWLFKSLQIWKKIHIINFMDDETQLKVRKFLKRLGISSQQELNQFIENNPDVKDLSIKVSFEINNKLSLIHIWRCRRLE